MRKIFLFNPTSEMAVANDTVSYTPPAFLRKFEKDVSPLLAFAGGSDDLLITDNIGQKRFRGFWEEAGVRLPEFTSVDDISGKMGNDTVMPVPWGWNRAVHKLFSPLKAFFDNSFIKSPNSEWEDSYRNAFSRETSVRFMDDVRSAAIGHEFISIPYIPLVVSSLKEIENWNKKGKLPYVFKTPWSSSGRGLYPITEHQFVERSRIWVKSRLKQQKKLIIEPWLNKLQDISFQFYIHTGGKIDFLGVNFFEAGRVGKFKKEYVGMPEVLRSRLAGFSLPDGWFDESAYVLKDVLKREHFHEFYSGPIGIDGIIFSDEKRVAKVHPCIEINFRLNMGYVNLKLKDILHPETTGEWAIRQFKPGEWKKFAEEKIKGSPIRREDGKILKGFLPFVPVTDEQLYGVWGEI